MGLCDITRELYVIVEHKLITLIIMNGSVEDSYFFSTTFEGWQDFMTTRAIIKRMFIANRETWQIVGH